MSDEPKTFYGKLAIIGGFVTALATLLGALYQIGWVGEDRRDRIDPRPTQEIHRQDPDKKDPVRAIDLL